MKEKLFFHRLNIDKKEKWASCDLERKGNEKVFN